ncbi:MAG: DUF167 domain-containing protein [Kiritimatiellae bacterium]|nr:DUF167 domain-containing protein [Kiritimatiellia bacterium]MDD3545043.1 DUF167 domain-containing protein [Kiritimatiellia bacterium]MDD4024349.1 DUF167 domain-containing protein [Kiritimatiellia bacterium]MDD4622570.1 DUF167 domain-containing protein [Kiritimatiellia bacterium]
MKWLIEAKDGCVITVKVTPRAAKSEILGAESEWLRVRVKAPPVDGKANTALIALFADVLGLHKRSVSVVAGQTARLKRVRVDGVTADEVSKIMS